MIRKLLFILAIALFILSSCRKDYVLVKNEQQTSVLFSSKISGQVQTRMSGNQWDSNDSISIFMYEGSSFSTNTLLTEGFNKKFITSNSGNFSPTSDHDAIQFPSGKLVKFISFYPYQQGNELSRVLDISNQQNLSAIDYLYGSSQNNSGYNQGPVQLVFERIMSKVQVRVQGEGIQSVTAKIVGLQTEGRYGLEDRKLIQGDIFKEVEGKVIQSGQETVIEWVVFPGKLSSASKIVFKSNTGESYSWEIGKQGNNFAAGNRYQYQINLSDDGTINPQPNISYMELPVISNSANLEYKFKMTPDGSKRNFSMLYDKKNRLAYWVAYPLSKSYLGSQSRTDNWGYDPDFSTSVQPLLSRGFGISGIDRGHQLPSADRTMNYQENTTTFYYSNMTAQVSSLNQGVWAKLENQIRTWATSTGVDTMYVVTGAAIQTQSDSKIDYVKDNAGKDVAKPKYYYKALAVKRGTEYYTIGFLMKNEVTDTKANYDSYRMTVSELEKETGYSFFPGLSTEKKQTINNSIWK